MLYNNTPSSLSCIIAQYSASATSHGHVPYSWNVNNSWDNCYTNARVHTDFGNFFLLSYFGVLARIKMCYPVIIRMCCIRLLKCVIQYSLECVASIY